MKQTPAPPGEPSLIFMAGGIILRRDPWQWVVALFMLIGLPLAGLLAAGRPIAPYLRFPPLTGQVDVTSFSWWFFGLYLVLDLALVIFPARLIWTTRPGPNHTPTAAPARPFPIWGWIGLLVSIAGWAMAWSRFAWFAPFQRHTFCLPWIGYIMVVNALSVKRSGKSLLTIAKGRFIGLALGSAVFWWFFEYLNGFVGNWFYAGIEKVGAVAYALSASLAFATVLPAVLSTQQWLLTFAPFGRGLQTNPWSWPRPRRTAGTLLLVVSSLGLFFLGIRPDLLFSLVWFAPLLIVTGLQAVAGQTTIFTPPLNGDWRGLISAAVAALICGFFWELWNVGSLAHWQYTVPYVNRFHLFAMPILGYGGYLPFGLECMLAGSLILGSKKN